MEKIRWIFVIGFAIVGPEIFGLSSPEFSFSNSFIWGGLFGIIGWIAGSIVIYIIQKVKE